jgi:hypothetical protein
MIQQAPESDRFKAEMRESSINDRAAEALLDRDEAKDFSSESNRDLPWPEENESKD